MASFDYARVKATAERLIDRFGQDAELVQYTNGGTDIAPARVAGTPIAIRVAEFKSKSMDRKEALAGKSLRMFYISTAAGATVKKSDTMTLDGISYELVEVRPYSPGGTVLYWEVYVGI